MPYSRRSTWQEEGEEEGSTAQQQDTGVSVVGGVQVEEGVQGKRGCCCCCYAQ